jgi:hypothetical protein
MIRVLLIGVAILVGGGLLGTALNILSAPSRVVNQVVSTQNILSSYDEFFALNARFQTRVSDIRSQKTLIASETDVDQKRVQSMNLIGMQSACRDLVTQYNASAQNKTTSWFLDGSLPRSLSLTDCE